MAGQGEPQAAEEEEEPHHLAEETGVDEDVEGQPSDDGEFQRQSPARQVPPEGLDDGRRHQRRCHEDQLPGLEDARARHGPVDGPERQMIHPAGVPHGARLSRQTAEKSPAPSRSLRTPGVEATIWSGHQSTA